MTNDTQLDAREVLEAYKRQPPIERRFEQLKTDYRVAPVFLKDGPASRASSASTSSRYWRSRSSSALRQAMRDHGLAALPMYPEDRDCRRPTARRLFDLFDPTQRHVFTRPGSEPIQFTTKLSPLHRQLLRLLSLPVTLYR